MTNGAAAAAAITQAIKASGAIISVESTDFMTILDKVDRPLVVCSESKFISTKYHYLTAYKGLIFYTKSPSPLMLRPSLEIVRAKKYGFRGNYKRPAKISPSNYLLSAGHIFFCQRERQLRLSG